MDAFESILRRMVGPPVEGSALPLFDPHPWLGTADAAGVNAAFLIALCGSTHPDFERATTVLHDPPPGVPGSVASFYRRGLTLVREEISRAAAADAEMATCLRRVSDLVTGAAPPGAGAAARPTAAEALWSIFVPEANGIIGEEARRVSELRAARTLTITQAGPDPIEDPGRQLLFTSNVLLTIPAASRRIDALPYPEDLRRDLERASVEAQQHWYDHPIQIGVEPGGNELLYGLRGLDEALAFEERRGGASIRATCVLSVSVTHPGLRRVAHRYLAQEMARSGRLRHLDVYLFTEAETRRLVDEVLAPAAGVADAADLLGEVFGVDGEYGRHYSFLKAISALWQVLIDPALRGTFKIDLDQVFPQEVLVAETGASAFEHLATPLWGARAIDAAGREVELGMVAGALVNERDIEASLFTPDLAYPPQDPTPEQHVFFSALPQALSTRAEMMERYDSPERDGVRTCLERVHVTGGTNGILVDALRRHRPFTPTFIGRAEDQAYILSTLGRSGPRLAYAHAAGLIMRHDKEAFAAEAIAAARVGRLVGDDVRILLFSRYADVIAEAQDGGALDRLAIKSLLGPFTGCFISRLPITVVMLRSALRTGRAFETGDHEMGRELAANGAQRIGDTLRLTADGSAFALAIERERLAWDRYYDALTSLEAALRAGDPAAMELRSRARSIITECRVGEEEPASQDPGLGAEP